MTQMHRVSVLSRAAIALAAIQLLIGLLMAVAGNPEGWIGGVLFALMYAGPLLLIAWGLQRGTERWRHAAGWGAVALAAAYSLIVVGNWDGYSSPQAAFAAGITAPTVVLDLAVFWMTVVRHGAAG